jgi:hypothetical protein
MISCSAIRTACRAVGAGLLGIFFAVSACNASTVAEVQAQLPAPADGMARVWFLRELQPGMPPYVPTIYANGTPLAGPAQGSAFYRDFPAGNYIFDVANCITQPGSAQAIALAPGSVTAVRVVEDTVGIPLGCYPAALYDMRQVPPQLLPDYLGGLVYLGSR